ncbi:hypothetical protein AAGS61_05745 [Lysinibacillus sp. KU-BSD001]
MILKLVISILLGRKKQYIKVVKVKKRNVLIQIEEYTPATELLQKLDD